jgi:hypothetical protein
LVGAFRSDVLSGDWGMSGYGGSDCLQTPNAKQMKERAWDEARRNGDQLFVDDITVTLRPGIIKYYPEMGFACLDLSGSGVSLAS